MSYFTLFVGSAFSIALPALAALFSITFLPRRFLPLAILFWLGLVNESVSYLLITHGRNNGMNSNMYTLLEGILFLLTFYSLKPGKTFLYWAAASVCTLVWMTDNVVAHACTQYNPLSRILFSFMILFFSLDRIIQMLVQPPLEPWRKIDLLFYFCFFIYYTYQAFILVYDVFPMNVSAEFYKRLYLILGAVNFITNLIYTVLIIWIRRQVAYTKR